MRHSTTRFWVWAPPACFFLLSLIVAVAAPDPGTRLFYLAMTLGTGYWLVRSLRVGVELASEIVVVHGQLRNRRFAMEDVRSARVAPMRTASPFYRFFPYLALELELGDGTTRHFDEVSAREGDRATIDAIADSINGGSPASMVPHGLSATACLSNTRRRACQCTGRVPIRVVPDSAAVGAGCRVGHAATCPARSTRGPRHATQRRKPKKGL